MGSQLLTDNLFNKAVKVMHSSRTLEQLSMAQKFCNMCREAWLDKHYPEISGGSNTFTREEAGRIWDNSLAYMTE